MDKFPKHEKAYLYALHCLGVHENPMRSNRGEVQVYNPSGGVDFFEDHDFVAGNGYAWCVDLWLTSWAVGAKQPFPYLSPGAYAIGNWAKKNGMAKPISQLVRGDGCVWREGSGHLSMFESYDQSKGLVHTIDGNWGDKVTRVIHKVSDLYVGIHVPETAVKVSVPKPYFVIATSVNGHKKILFSKYATRRKVLGILPRFLVKYGVNGVTIRRRKKK
jgi:hypothetical protein